MTSVEPPGYYRLLSVIGEGAEPADYASIVSDRLDPVVLSPGRAFEVLVHHRVDFGIVLARARDVAAKLGRAHDINLLEVDHFATPLTRRKKLLVADMDSTIIGVECLDELADVAGRQPEIAAITAQAMRGEIEFEAALEARVRMLKGLKLGAIDRIYTERVRLNRGARTLVATMRAHGTHTVLVSGNFGCFTTRVAQAAGFDEQFSNVLLDDGKALTGEIATPILGRAGKVEVMDHVSLYKGIQYDEILAVGDGANDLGMIKLAGLGVAYHAKPIVAAAADAAINHNDLTALLYLQGYRDREIVRAD